MHIMRKIYSLVLLASVAISPCVSVLAQQADPAQKQDVFLTTNPSAGSLVQQTGHQSAAVTAVNLGFEEHPDLVHFGPLGKYLFDRGITLTSSFTEEVAGNPAGGNKQGLTSAGQVYLGADFDLGRLMNAQGAFVHFAMVERHGVTDAHEFIGNAVSTQEIFGIQGVHLAIFTFEQKLFNDRLDVTVGRYPANITFLDSPIYCNFQINTACGNPALIYFASNFSGFPSSSWGSDVRAWLTDKVYAHVGAFEVNPDDHLAKYVFGRWDTDNATGAVMPFELGYATNFKNDELPRHYQVGGWYDSSTYSSPLFSSTGGFAALDGQSYATEAGRSGVWFRFDQMLTRPDPTSKRGLTAFGVFMDAVGGQPQMRRYYELGLLQQGTFAGRDDDTVGFLVGVQEWSNFELQNLRLARLAAGSIAPLPHGTVMMELNYGAQLTPAVRVMPLVQAIINPDNINEASRRTNIPSAFVIGAKISIDLTNLAGFPAPKI